MTPQTKKGLIITGVVAVLVFVTIKVMAKKPAALPNAIPSTDTGAGGGFDNSGSVDTNPPVVDTTVIGKNAIAKSDNVYVRKDSDAYSNLVYNNIIGVLNRGESAGIVSSSAIGTDGKVWYFVGRGTEYNCDFGTCSFHLSHSSGWIKAADVSLV